jgi:hypothetical protein
MMFRRRVAVRPGLRGPVVRVRRPIRVVVSPFRVRPFLMTRAIVRTTAVVALTAVTVNELHNMAICKGKKGEFREMRDTDPTPCKVHHIKDLDSLIEFQLKDSKGSTATVYSNSYCTTCGEYFFLTKQDINKPIEYQTTTTTTTTHATAVPVQQGMPQQQQPQMQMPQQQQFGALPPQQYTQQVVPQPQYGYPPNMTAAPYQSMPQQQGTPYPQQPNQQYVVGPQGQQQQFMSQPAPYTQSGPYQQQPQQQYQVHYTTHQS